MLDASQNIASEMSAKLFSVGFFEMEGLISQYIILCFVSKKYTIKIEIRKGLYQSISE